MSVSKIVAAAASGAGGGAGLDVDDVFSTFLIDGNGSTQAINNGLDLSGEGGLVWIKNRDDSGSNNFLYDTARPLISGRIARLISNSTTTSNEGSNELSSFNNNGFTLGGSYSTNSSSYDYASWSFRKTEKFFDIVTYNGTGSAQNISHNLGSVPGMIIVKITSGSDGWHVYHRKLNGGSSPEDYYLQLNSSDQETDNASIWNDTAPTDSVFTVGTNGGVNGNGDTYVAYLFAHHNNDGEFGSGSDQDIIKCGSYTGNGSADGPSVTLGFEPQWIMFKRASGGSGNWGLIDNMRGAVTSGNDRILFPDDNGEEATSLNSLEFTSTGFKITRGSGFENSNGHTYVYMAIRRGPLAAPTDATKVFAIDNQTASSAPFLTSNFAVDMVLRKDTAGGNTELMSRLTQNSGLIVNSTGAEQSDSVAQFDFNDGCLDGTSTNTSRYGWMWKRAPGYFDVCCYSGTGSARTVSHNLGVVPEMMWVKSRGRSEDWNVYHSATGNQAYIKLNSTDAATTSNTNTWNSTTPTASVFTLGTRDGVNKNNDTFIAYLFATVSGVSKVGSYTGNGTGQNIDCGFSSGARFVLIKKTGGSEGWKVHDSVRGIVAGNDPFIELNNANAENSSFDLVDPYSSGFAVTTFNGWNENGYTYIFYAIA